MASALQLSISVAPVADTKALKMTEAVHTEDALETIQQPQDSIE